MGRTSFFFARLVKLEHKNVRVECMVELFPECTSSKFDIVQGIQASQIISPQSAPFVSQPARLRAILKWAGGKEHELRHIRPLLPAFQRYFEPFVGGGAVFFAVQARQAFINDRSTELVSLYRMVAENNADFFQMLHGLLTQWQRLSRFVDCYAPELEHIYKNYAQDRSPSGSSREQLLAFVHQHAQEFQGVAEAVLNREVENFRREIERNLLSKTARMQRLEQKKGQMSSHDIVANLESALKSAFYMHLRHLYNQVNLSATAPGTAAAIFFFIRENAYAAMFRYNKQGEFNVPYGGISYNRKDLTRKVNYLQSPALRLRLAQSVIENLDFETFLQKHLPGPHDFIFLDPPYDSEFSTYTQNTFSKEDQERLAHYLLGECRAKFMLVIKNTPLIYNLYSHRGLHIQAFDKKYLVSFQDRNNRVSEHLIITNFATAENRNGRDLA